MTPEQEKILQEAHDSIKSIEQLLKGYGKEKGLLGEFETHKKSDVEFRKEFYKFRTWVYVLVAFASGGGGAIGAGLSRFFNG